MFSILEQLLKSEVIVSVVSGFFGAFCLWLKYVLEKKNNEKVKDIEIKKAKELSQKTDKVILAIEFDKMILDRLDFLLGVLGADRIAIYRFHNGGYYYPKTDMQKFSMVYERLSPGIAPLINYHQNFLVSAFHWYLNKIIKQYGFKYNDVSQIEDFTMKTFLSDLGVKSVFVFPIFSLNNQALGFCTVHFIKNKETFNNEGLELIENEIKVFSGYLESHEN